MFAGCDVFFFHPEQIIEVILHMLDASFVGDGSHVCSSLRQFDLSNGKTPWLFRVYRTILPSCEGIIINHHLPLLLVFHFYPFSYHRAPVEHSIVGT